VANAVADATGCRPRSYPLAPWKVLSWLGEAQQRAQQKKTKLGYAERSPD
jgi:hypothetical protein